MALLAETLQQRLKLLVVKAAVSEVRIETKACLPCHLCDKRWIGTSLGNRMSWPAEARSFVGPLCLVPFGAILTPPSRSPPLHLLLSPPDFQLPLAFFSPTFSHFWCFPLEASSKPFTSTWASMPPKCSPQGTWWLQDCHLHRWLQGFAGIVVCGTANRCLWHGHYMVAQKMTP